MINLSIHRSFIIVYRTEVFVTCSSEYCQLCNLTTIFHLPRSVTETAVFGDRFLKDLIHNILSIITFIFLFPSPSSSFFLHFLLLNLLLTFFIYKVIFKVFSLFSVHRSPMTKQSFNGHRLQLVVHNRGPTSFHILGIILLLSAYFYYEDEGIFLL
jgi:hypothetical protein